LVANSRPDLPFCCCGTSCSETPDGIILPRDAADALGVQVGDTVRIGSLRENMP